MVDTDTALAGFTQLWGRDRAAGCSSLWPAWRSHLGLTGAWPGEDMVGSLLERFCDGLWCEDPAALAALDGPALFAANHQVAVESILFAAAITPFLRRPLHSIAKAEHADSWVGQLFGLLYAWPGARPLETIFFNRLGDAGALLELMRRLRAELPVRRCGLLVHVAASRMLTCRDPLRTMSGVLIDLAIDLGMPIFPVRFRGGLPVEPLEGFIDFPVGFGAQRYLVGRPIPAAELSRVHYGERRMLVMDRINALGGPPDSETPAPPDPAFRQRMRQPMTRFGVLEPAAAVTWAALSRLAAPQPEIAEVLRGIEAGRYVAADTPAGRWSAALARWLTEGRIPVSVAPAASARHAADLGA